MKIPWTSSIVFYRTVNGLCVADREAQLIFVREVLPTLNVSQIKHAEAINNAFKNKLSDCPFMVIDDTAYTCNGTIVPWDACSYAINQATIVIEDESVLVSLTAPLTIYESDGSIYAFKSAGSIFCKTMCLPKQFKPQIVPKLQNLRKKTIAMQLESGRIFVGDGKAYTCYSAVDFSVLHLLN
jgi:hypothetical protein